MSDDVTNLADVLVSAQIKHGHVFASIGLARAVLASDWLAERDATNRLIGAAMAHTDAIAAHAELVERVEALIAKWADRAGVFDESMDHEYHRHIDRAYVEAARQLRALIDPEATS